MESTTMDGAPPRPLGFGEALGTQLRLLTASRRPLWLILALLAVLGLAGEPWSSGPLTRLLSAALPFLVLVGPLWAFAVFHDEGPSSRLYHWSQPVARHVHSLARLAAGIVWLWAAYLFLAAVAWLLAGLEGDAWQLAELSVAAWVNYLTAPVIGYLAVSLITLVSDYPIRWVVGLLFAVPITMSLLNESLGLDRLVAWLGKPLVEAWGLAPVMLAPMTRSMRQVARVLDPAGDGAGMLALDASLWWAAMPLWLLLFVGLAVLLATRHPDVFPRWRGRG